MRRPYHLSFLILLIVAVCFGCASIEDDYEDESYASSVETSEIETFQEDSSDDEPFVETSEIDESETEAFQEDSSDNDDEPFVETSEVEEEYDLDEDGEWEEAYSDEDEEWEEAHSDEDGEWEEVHSDESWLGPVSASYSVVLPEEQPFDCPSDTSDSEVDDPDRVICIEEDDSFGAVSGADVQAQDNDLIIDLLEIFPDYMRENVVLVAFASADSSEGVASIRAIYDDNVYWEMWINTSPEIEDTHADWMDTLAHELMHYLSLSPTVITLGDESCGDTFKASGYCPIAGSFFAEYIRLFWEPIYGDWTVDNFNEYYDAHPDDFVTPYAVSEPAEDIAETFAKFVFQERPTDISTIKEQKIDFFWQSEQFVSMRSEIRAAYDE